MSVAKPLLLYVDPYAMSRPGIARKIAAQNRALAEGYRVRRVCVVPDIASQVLRLVGRFWNELLAILRTLRCDAVYYRYSPVLVMLNPALWIISRFRPVWVEYNSVYRGELALVAPAAARLHAWSMFWLRHSRARHLPINREIGIEEGLNGNVQVLGNGWDSPSQSVSVELAEDHCQKLGELSKQYRPLGVFVAGDNAAWHGFDRILKVVDQHQFGLILVGPRQEGELVDLLTERQQLVQLGYLEPAALPAVYSFADFGFGTFALDRKNQKEACPLKVRDYLTSGLRVVINYADPLLDVPWASPFLYQYEKDKAKTLLAFLNSPYDRDRLAEEACERLDWVALFAEVGVLGGAGA